MRQHRRAGEKMFVDYAGSTVALSDGARAQVFVSAMAASSCVFACATPTQRLDDWIEGMVRALHFYGGAPALIIPDNATAVIASADRYEPRANDTVQDFARYYGTSVLPARPRAPKDKATAESSVQVVGRWVLARLRHHRFDTVAQVDAAIAKLLPSVNERPIQKLPGSRASVFAELDAPALMPLPPQRYELARFKTVTVHIDYHIEVDGHRYSVPHALVGQTLEARLTKRGVELLLRGQRVALPPEHLPQVGGRPPCQLMERLLLLAARLKPRQLTTSKRAPKPQVPKGFVDGSLARSHVATARVIKAGRATP